VTERPTITGRQQEARLEAELAWLRGVIADLREGRLTWSDKWLGQIAAAFGHADATKEDRDDSVD
jgi:hypothetical protein